MKSSVLLRFVAVLIVVAAAIACSPILVSASRLGDALKPHPESEEITSLRTQYSKTYQNPDGTRTWSASMGKVHFKNHAGNWDEVDLDIKRLSEGGRFAYCMTRNDYESFFAADASRRIVALFRVRDCSAGFGLLGGRRGRVTTEGNSITYHDALPGADLHYVTDFDQLREEIILHSAPPSNEWRFALHLKGVRFEQGKAGTLDFVDVRTGKRVWTMPKPYMVDAKGAYSEAVTKRLEVRNGKSYLLVRADRKWLTAPDRAYPVAVDPTWDSAGYVGGILQCAQKRSTAADSLYEANNWVYAGSSGTASPYTNYRSAIRWAMDGAPTKSQVVNASNSVRVRLYFSWPTTTGYPTNAVSVYQPGVNGPWTGTSLTWSNIVSGGGPYATVNCGNTTTAGEWKEWSWNGSTDYLPSAARGISIKGSIEDTANAHKQFHSICSPVTGTRNPPVLQIDYTGTPPAPANNCVRDGDFQNGGTVAAIADYWTPKYVNTGTSVTFAMASSGGESGNCQTVNCGNTNTTGPNCDAIVYQRVPALPGGKYIVTAWGKTSNTNLKASLRVDGTGGTNPTLYGDVDNTYWSGKAFGTTGSTQTSAPVTVDSNGFLTIMLYADQTAQAVYAATFDSVVLRPGAPSNASASPSSVESGGYSDFSVTGASGTRVAFYSDAACTSFVGSYNPATETYFRKTNITSTLTLYARNEIECTIGSGTVYTYSTTPTPVSATVTVVAGCTDVAVVTQPSSASVCAGATATFNVVASGTTPINYQWQVDKGSGFANCVEGVDGTGTQTATMTTVAATTGMNGYKYRCQMTNCTSGSATTDGNATLTVNAVPDSPAAQAGTPVDAGTITWNWDTVPGASGYRLWTAASDGTQIDGIISNNYYTESGFANPGTQYTRYVESISPAGCVSAVRTQLTGSTLVRYCTENGDFEGGFYSVAKGSIGVRWQVASGGDGTEGYAQSTTAHGGNYSQRFYDPSGGQGFTPFVYQKLNVQPSRQYVARYWHRRAVDNGFVTKIGIDVDGGTSFGIQWQSGASGTSGNTWYLKETAPFTSGSGGVITIGLAGGNNNSDAYGYVDDVSVAPAKPTSTGGGGAVCYGGSTTLTASGGFGGSDSELHWYTGPGGTGTHVGTGTSRVVNNITEAATFYPRWEDSAHSGTCRYSDDGAPVSVTVIPLPTAPSSATASPSVICAGESSTLTASGGSGTTCAWYAGSCGGTAVDTGTSIVVSPSSTTTYYVRWENSCGVSSCAEVTVTVNPRPSAPSNPGAAAGSTSQITWSWTKAAGAADYKLYTSSTGGTGTSLGDVASYQESGLSANTQYQRWVSSVSAEGCESSTRLELPKTYTLANVPDAPAVGSPTSTTLDVNPAAIEPAGTELAIVISGGGYADDNDYVKADGTIDADGTAVWQTDAEWGTVTVSGLNADTEYTFKVKARNGDGIETSLSAGATGTTSSSCAPVEIGQDPAGQSVCAGSTATFAVAVSGEPPFEYTWQKWDSGSEAWVDLEDEEGHISGAATDTLQIDGCDASDAGSYRCHVENCSGVNSADSDSAALTVTQPPTAASVGGAQTICYGGTTSGLGGNTPSVGTGQWSIVSGGTGTFSPNASDPNAAFTHTGGSGPVVLRWTISNPPCGDSYAEVQITVTQPPTTASAGDDQSICYGGTTSGLGGNTPSVGTGQWSIVSGGTGTFSPDASTPNAAFTHTGGSGPVVLRWTISNPPCPSSYDEVSVTINALPSAPTDAQAVPSTICAGESVTLSATAGEGGDTVEWFTGSCGGTPVTSPVSPASTTTYYARTKNSATGCVSAACAEVTVTVNALPSAPTGAQAAPSTICAGESVTLSATAGEGGDTVEWFTGSCGGTPVTSPVSPASTTTYYARTKNSATGCVSAACAEVTVTVNSVPDAPEAAPASGVTATSVTWNWQAVSGASGYRLWTAASGGTQIDGTITNTYYTESGLNPGTNYARYVEAVTASGCVSPRTELTAATSTRYCLDNAGFETFTSGLAEGWALYRETGTQTTFASTTDKDSGEYAQEIYASTKTQRAFVYQKVNVRGGAYYTVSARFKLSNNGFRSLVNIDPNGGDVSNAPGVSSYDDSSTSDRTVYHDLTNNPSDPVFRETDGVVTIFLGFADRDRGAGSVHIDNASILPTSPVSASASPASYCANAVPSTIDLWVTGGYGIMSAVHWYTDAGCTVPLTQGGSPVTGSPVAITAPSTTTTYYARYEGDCGNSAAQSVTVTVLPLPVAPESASADPAAFCSGASGDVTLTASGGSGTTLKWYSGSCGGTWVGDGSPLVIPKPTSTTTYYARWENSCGVSSCAEVTVTVNAPPSAAVSGGGTICAGGSATVQAALTGAAPWSITWSDDVTQSEITESPAVRTVSPGSTTTYTVTAVSDANCSGTASGSAVVTVVQPPSTSLAATAEPATVCSGDSSTIRVAGSEAGVSYALFVKGGSQVGDSQEGTGDDLLFSTGSLTETTTFTVKAVRSPCAAVSLDTEPTVVVDAVAPTVLYVTSDTENGTYGLDADDIDISVKFSEPVTVGSTETKPRIKLETGEVDRYAEFLEADTEDTSVLHFTYTVKEGDQSSDLDYTGTDALELNGGSITDECGNDAVLTLPAPGTEGSLAYNKDIVIATAVARRISGTVSMETYSSNAYSFSRIVRFTATDSGGEVLKTWDVPVSFVNTVVEPPALGYAVGSYTLTDVPEGVAFLSAKSNWSLRRKLPVALDEYGQASDVNFPILGGDLDASNSINILDYVRLKTKWHSADAAADINADATVDLLDYSIMKANWFRIGDSQ